MIGLVLTTLNYANSLRTKIWMNTVSKSENSAFDISLEYNTAPMRQFGALSRTLRYKLPFLLRDDLM